MLNELNRKRTSLEELSWKLLLILIPVILINVFFFQNFWIPTGSMEPTLECGDTIIVNKCCYWRGTPGRGDIVVFNYPEDVHKCYIKRVIGLPGEKVEIKNNTVYINGQAISESYVKEKEFADYSSVKVPDGHYFVLGDNRNNSEDSRAWGFLPKKNLVGKAVFRFWPVRRMAIIH
jgi:signal peptidase I